MSEDLVTEVTEAVEVRPNIETALARAPFLATFTNRSAFRS